MKQKKVYSEREREREMVGSGTTTTTDRSKEAVGMMALHEALRSVCLNSDWTYSVFWTIRPRPYASSLSLCILYVMMMLLSMVFYEVFFFFSPGSSPFYFLAEE